MNTIKYVFQNKRPELNEMVVKYGLKPAKSSLELYKKVNAVVAKYKDEALKDIAKLHPDRDLILWSVGYKESSNGQPEVEEKSSAAGCGCSGADGSYSNCGGCGCGCGVGCGCGCGNNQKNRMQYSNAEGQPVSDTIKNNLPLVVIGSLLVVGGLLFLGRQSG